MRQLNSCQGEGAAIQVNVLHNDVNIIGGLYFASGPVANPVGIALGVGGGTPVAVAGANIITRVIGCNGGAIAFTNSSGSNLVRVGTWQSAGPFTTGTPNISDRVDLQCHGQATDRNRLASIQQSSDTFGVTVNDLPTVNLWQAHRGTGKWHTTPSIMMAPENSMSAFEIAFKAGASLIDIDSSLTADGVPVAMHDSTVDRTTQGTGLVSIYPSHALPLLDMRESTGNG